jgi:hypothetical protein
MTPVQPADRLLSQLGALPSPQPDLERAARVRARCCAQLARGKRRSERLAATRRFAHHVVAPVIVAALCAAYLADMIGIAIRTLTV